MQHKCKVTVLKTALFEEFQEKYLAEPKSGACDFYKEGQEFIFERYGEADDFWTMGQGKHCSEAWDCISRYIYTALQGGAIMRHWTNDDRIMIACCNDGTRPVVFKIQRMDYKVLFTEGISHPAEQKKLAEMLKKTEGITDVVFDDKKPFTEIFMDFDVADECIAEAVKECGGSVVKLE